MIALKICGITSLRDVELAIINKASAIGFIFYKNSPRYISPFEVSKWIERVSDKVKLVGVFVNEKIENVHSVSDMLGLNFVQLHGQETPQYCVEIKNPVIKAFHVDKSVDIDTINKYSVHAVLLDTYLNGIIGGTGISFNWDLINRKKINAPIILSGG